MTIADHCPACNRPYALIGRVHRCVPRLGSEILSESNTGKTGMAGVKGPVRRSTAGSELRVGALDADPASVSANPAPKVSIPEGNPAGTQAIGAYQVAMCETPPSTGVGEHLHSTANRDEPAPLSNVVPIRKPKRDRAAYMRSYRARVKQNAGGAA